MEEKQNPTENPDTAPEEQEQPREGYVPRPAGQVWLARIGLVIFIIFVIAQILQIYRGGQ